MSLVDEAERIGPGLAAAEANGLRRLPDDSWKHATSPSGATGRDLDDETRRQIDGGTAESLLPPVRLVNSVEHRRVAARDLLLALSYGADGEYFPSIAPHADLPTDGAAFDVLRRSDWCRPDADERTVRYTAIDGSATIAFEFDDDGCIVRVSVTGSGA